MNNSEIFAELRKFSSELWVPVRPENSGPTENIEPSFQCIDNGSSRA